MKRLLPIAFLLCLAGRPAEVCPGTLAPKWNRFVEDANSYVKELQGGVVDAKTRVRLNSEWRAVIDCECW
jgi:hypothetical protein